MTQTFLQIVALYKCIIIYAVNIVLIVIFVFGNTYGYFSGVSSGSECLASLFNVLTYVRKYGLWPETSFMYLPIASVF